MSDSNNQIEWFEWVKAILIALILVFLLRSFVFATSIVEGTSMVPALENGERIIFNKFIYLVSEPKRGDIIIIEQPNKNYVKRIIGMPGETIEGNNFQILIDGEEQELTFVERANYLLSGNFEPVLIPDDYYFVMGDNRALSKDSRNGLGLIKRSEIVGRSEFVIYPFDEWEITR